MTNKALILATDITEQAQQSGRRAGTSLEQIASEQGDTAMLAVFAEMDILTVAKIVREHDATIPSIATWLMDADSIKKLLNVEPSYWQNLDEESLFCAQTEAHSLLAQIFLSYEDDEKQQEDPEERRPEDGRQLIEPGFPVPGPVEAEEKQHDRPVDPDREHRDDEVGLYVVREDARPDAGHIVDRPGEVDGDEIDGEGAEAFVHGGIIFSRRPRRVPGGP